jgi:hypothetical protein
MPGQSVIGEVVVRGCAAEASAQLGTRFPLYAGTTTIGRGEDNTISLTAHDSISAEHGKLEITETGEGQYMMQYVDLGSTNLSCVSLLDPPSLLEEEQFVTFKQKHQVLPQQPQELESQARLLLGDVTLRCVLWGAVSQPAEQSEVPKFRTITTDFGQTFARVSPHTAQQYQRVLPAFVPSGPGQTQGYTAPAEEELGHNASVHYSPVRPQPQMTEDPTQYWERKQHATTTRSNLQTKRTVSFNNNNNNNSMPSPPARTMTGDRKGFATSNSPPVADKNAVFVRKGGRVVIQPRQPVVVAAPPVPAAAAAAAAFAKKKKKRGKKKRKKSKRRYSSSDSSSDDSDISSSSSSSSSDSSSDSVSEDAKIEELSAPESSEGETTPEEEIPLQPEALREPTPFCVVITGLSLSKQEMSQLTKMPEGLIRRGVEGYEPRDCTHLVSCNPVQRTVKFMTSFSSCKHVLSRQWLEESLRQGMWARVGRKHKLVDKVAENLWDFKLAPAEAIGVGKHKPLRSLAGYHVYSTGDGVMPAADLLKIVTSAGGRIRTKKPRVYNENIICLSCEADEKQAKRLRRKGYTVYTREVIFRAVLRRKLALTSPGSAAFILEEPPPEPVKKKRASTSSKKKKNKKKSKKKGSRKRKKGPNSNTTTKPKKGSTKTHKKRRKR